jgi:GT2 family glycosyltransferase
MLGLVVLNKYLILLARLGGAKLYRFVEDVRSVLGADLRLLRHPKPLGYLAAATDASKLAKGDFLLLLNNDLTLHRFCVANLLATFETHPQVGLVAPRFQDASGKLLESGGLIFNDAKG